MYWIDYILDRFRIQTTVLLGSMRLQLIYPAES